MLDVTAEECAGMAGYFDESLIIFVLYLPDM